MSESNLIGHKGSSSLTSGILTTATRANATHMLRCHKGIGSNYWAYHQPCHILKEMPDGKRYKVLTFGYQNSMHGRGESRIRYVEKSRVRERTPAERLHDAQWDDKGIFINSETSGDPGRLGA